VRRALLYAIGDPPQSAEQGAVGSLVVQRPEAVGEQRVDAGNAAGVDRPGRLAELCDPEQPLATGGHFAARGLVAPRVGGLLGL
jgi:hypothetical protein